MNTVSGRNPAISTLIPMAILLACSSLAFAEPAGRVVFVAGSVLAIDPAGNVRTLERGASVEEGDTLATGDGRLQVQFKDGAFLALQPQTRFKVARYRHTGAGDSQDSVVMSLLKGGLRTISGLVGKANRDAYRMETEVATIGIRGTDYALELNAALAGHVSEGAIEVCNGAGCTLVQRGFAFNVQSFLQPPVLSEQRAFLPPTPSDRLRARAAGNPGDPRGGANPEHSASGAESPAPQESRAPEDRASPALDASPRPGAAGNAGANPSAAAPGLADAGARSGNSVSALSGTGAPSTVGVPSESAASAASGKIPPGLARKLNDPLSGVAGPPGLTKKQP
jgi:hypothetical protein